MARIRRPHILNPNKKTEIPQNIIYFDSEARVDLDDSQYIDRLLAGEKVEKEHDVYLICAAYTRRGVEKVEWKDYHKPGFKMRFWQDVDEYTAAGRKTWIFAHNARYDVLATGAAKYLVKLGYTVTSFSDDNPFILQFTKEVKSKKKTILILSSTNYYHNSLAELGKTFGLEKLEGAFNDTLEKAITYCRRDVEILKIAMESLIDFIIKEDLGTFSQTAAGQAFAAYRHKFMQHDIYIHCDARALEIERESYCGGRTEAWFIGEVPEKVFGCDINSEYPSVMIKERFPTFLRTIRNKLTIEDAMDFINQGYLLVARAHVNTDIPIFPYKAGRLIFPTGDYWTTLATPELIAGIERGLILELKDVCIYEGEEIFHDYIDYFYTARLEAKKVKDAVLDMLYKLFMNVLYGKFGQKAIEWERVGDAPPEELRVDRIYNFDTRKREMVKIFGGSVFKHIEKEGEDNEASNSFPAIAAHVTSYARMLLWRYIEIAGYENVYYMDTDSIFTNEVGYGRLLAAGVISDTVLGALKLEKTGEMIIRGVKDYSLNGKAKMKGIPKSAIQIDENSFLVNTWVGVSKMIAGGSVDGYKNILMIKTLKREYTKGLIMPDGKVFPLRFMGSIPEVYHEALNSKVIEKEYCK